MEISVSDSFKKNTTKAILAITLFIFIYLILLAISIGLAVVCIGFSLTMLVNYLSLFTGLLAIAICGFAGFILYFLIKFFFKQHIVDQSNMLEMTADEEPKLFEIIQEIVKDVDTKFPKKVFLTQDINAAVFYNSSFWSMLFPVRKNLMIGVGLINTSSVDELRAVLAHEFGHFSQKSMTIGSYVYNINEAIYNMLFENDDFSETLQAWSNISGIIALAGLLAVKIIQGIQWILVKMYNLINISYLALSRDMEFHADEIAVRTVSSQALEQSLSRMDLSNYAYSTTVNFYVRKGGKELRSSNIYQDMDFVLKDIALNFKYTIEDNGLPNVSLADINKYNKSKLNIKDQWTSHPTLKERVEAIRKLNIERHYCNNAPARSIFHKMEEYEEFFTEKVFLYNLQVNRNAEVLSHKEFEKEYANMATKSTINELYNDYYDYKEIIPFDIVELDDRSTDKTLDELFSNEKVSLYYEYSSLLEDKEALNNIASGNYKIKTFDYDGVKYRQKDATSIIKQIDREIDRVNTEIIENDKEIYVYFHTLAKQQNREGEFNDLYNQYLAQYSQKLKDNELLDKVVKGINSLNSATSYASAVAATGQLASTEKELRLELTRLMSSELVQDHITEQIRKSVDQYTSEELSYIVGNAESASYNETNLNILFENIEIFGFLVAKEYFASYKRILDLQVDLYDYNVSEFSN